MTTPRPGPGGGWLAAFLRFQISGLRVIAAKKRKAPGGGHATERSTRLDSTGRQGSRVWSQPRWEVPVRRLLAAGGSAKSDGKSGYRNSRVPSRVGQGHGANCVIVQQGLFQRHTPTAAAAAAAVL